MTGEIDLGGVIEAGKKIVEGGVRGRLVVKIGVNCVQDLSTKSGHVHFDQYGKS